METKILNGKWIFGLILIGILIGSVSAEHTATVTVSPEYVRGGATDTYTFEITNNGDDSLISIKITAPSGFTVETGKSYSCPTGWSSTIMDTYLKCETTDPTYFLGSGSSANISFYATSDDPVSDSEYTWTVDTTDNTWTSSQNTDAKTTVDVTAPEVSISELSPDPTSDNIPSFSGIATDTTTNVVEIRYKVDDGSWQDVDSFTPDKSVSYTFTTSQLDDGSHTVYVKAKDEVGNEVEEADYASDGFMIDTAKPTTSDDAPSGWQTTSPITITLTPSDPDPSSGIAWTKYCTDTDNNCDPASGTDYTGPVEISSEGITYFRYASQDNAGNTQDTVSKAIQIDTVDPTGSAISPEYSNTLTFDVSYTASDDTSGVQYVELYYTTDGGTSWTKYAGTYTASPISFTASSDGTYGFYLVVTDNAGNSEDAPASGTTPDDSTIVDTQLPKVSTVSSDGQTYNTETASPVTITVTFNEDISNTPTITVDTEQTVTNCGDEDAKTFCFDYTIPTSTEATKTITINDAEDLAGNVMDVDNTHTFKVDTIKPSVSSYTLNGEAESVVFNPNSASVEITITATEPVDWTSIKIEKVGDSGVYRYYYPSSCDGNSQCTQSWDGSLTAGTLSDGEYKIKVKMEDRAGNIFEGYLTPYTITVDTQNPTATITAPNDGDYIKETIDVTGTATDTNFKDYKVEYCLGEYTASLKGADRLVETQNNDGTWEWANPDLDKTNGEGACPSNIVGVTALGLLNAYQLSGDSRYLDAAKISGDAIVACGYDKDNDKYYSQDIEFLARLGEVTGDTTYTNKAVEIMEYFMTQDNRYCPDNGCTAAELAAFYQGRLSNPNDAGYTEWQLASWVRAAQLTGKTTWANDMINEINDDISGETPYFDITNTEQTYYIIGLSGVISATGNTDAIQKLVDIQNPDGSWIDPNGAVQDTAYAVMALMNIEETEGGICGPYYAEKGAMWLMNNQDVTGGWIESDSTEYTEVDSEAVQALYEFIKDESPFCTDITTGSTAVDGGTLATWDTTTVSDGIYTLKLTVNDLAGNSDTDEIQVTVDNTPPESQTYSPDVAQAAENEIQTEFKVCWSGDDYGGSGISEYLIEVSIDGGPWTEWLVDNYSGEGDCEWYQGTIGHNYCFRSMATDNLGNAEQKTDPDTCTDVVAYSFDIDLEEGWNLISVPVIPMDQSIEVVLNDVMGNLSGVWTYDPLNPNAVDGWLSYAPGVPSNLDTMTAGYGYWIYMENPDTLTVSGTLMAPGQTPPMRTLVPGWNLIGHYGVYPKLGECALSSMINTYTGMPRWVDPLWGFEDGAFFAVYTWWYEEGYMNPGYGYWIALGSDQPEVMYVPAECPVY